MIGFILSSILFINSAESLETYASYRNINIQSLKQICKPDFTNWEVIGVKRGSGLYGGNLMLPYLGVKLFHIRSYWGERPMLSAGFDLAEIGFSQSVLRYGPEITIMAVWTPKLGLAWQHPRVELSTGLSLLGIAFGKDIYSHQTSKSTRFSLVKTDLRWMFAGPIALELQHYWFPFMKAEEEYKHYLGLTLSANLILDNVRIHTDEDRK